MADPSPESTEPGPEPDGAGQEPASVEPDDGDQTPPTPGKTYPEAYVRQIRRESAGYRNKLAEVEERLQTFEDRDKSENEKLSTRLAEAESRASTAESRLIRYEVAAEHDLDMSAASFLTGTTREEIEASAEALAELLKDKAPGALSSFDGGARAPAPPAEKPPAEAHNDFLLRALGRKPS